MFSDRSISDGVLSLEVRWIIPGPLAPEMIEWFGPFPGRDRVPARLLPSDRNESGHGHQDSG